MKTTIILPVVLSLMVSFARNGRCQTEIYQFTIPISGSLTMSARDLNGPEGSSGDFELNFNTLAETIYLDPAGTLRQIGTISFTPSATNFQFEEIQTIPQPFPSPPTNVSGNVTVYLAPSGNNLVFDTGPQPLTWNPSLAAYTVANANIFVNGISMVGSYVLVTGGQTNSNSFSYSLSLEDAANESIFSALTFTTLSLTGSPSSVQLSGLGITYQPDGAIFFSPGKVVDVTASSGFELQLSPGAEAWPGNAGDFGELFAWSSPGTVIATNVPGGAATITNQPPSLVVDAHDTATFNVGVSGTVPLNYQWSFNETNIAGAIFSSLTISNVTPDDLGAYTVAITNAFGLDISSNATLSMRPFIATPFTGATVYWGQNATLNLQAWGTGPLGYQWFQNGILILNATNQTLPLTDIQFTNAGFYSVIVTSSLGTVTNAPAQVIVESAGVSFGLYPGITINGVVGYNYIIQRTADLSNTNSWVGVANIILPQPVLLWVDTNTDASLPANPHHFYRVLPGQ